MLFGLLILAVLCTGRRSLPYTRQYTDHYVIILWLFF